MFAKLHRDSLAQQIVQNLIEYIRAERLNPGDTLPAEGKLAELFGVSRPVIREAMKTLEGRGIIQIYNGKAATLKPISSETLRDFFQYAIDLNHDTFLELTELRRGIEVHAARLAAARRTPEQLAAMRQTVAQMREHLHEPEAFAEYDVEFHLQIASATHNSLIYHLVKSIRDSLKDAVLEGLRHRMSAEEFERVQARHEDLLAQFERGDSRGAAEAMERHFDEAIKATPITRKSS